MKLRVGALVLLTFLATPAVAGVLPFDGAFGDTAGCALWSDGIVPTGQGEFYLLTPNTFASYPVQCDFRSAVPSGSLGILANALCHTESEQDVENIRVIDHGAAGYGILPDSGGIAEVGPFPACPPRKPGAAGEVKISP